MEADSTITGLVSADVGEHVLDGTRAAVSAAAAVVVFFEKRNSFDIISLCNSVLVSGSCCHVFEQNYVYNRKFYKRKDGVCVK